MGQVFVINLLCKYCEKINEDISFAPTSDIDTFECFSCKKKNFIEYGHKFQAIKIEDVTVLMIKNNFLQTTSQYWNDEVLQRIIKNRFNDLKCNKFN